ncbi:hypothetical protein [Paraflavitalea speifideaquila]|uniref:hypothetical protein n=1 Tax=Paraflavitalea speifideaquila TaxID=3076558 RepID=UPI00331306F0
MQNDPLPVFTISYTGFVNGDDAGDLKQPAPGRYYGYGYIAGRHLSNYSGWRHCRQLQYGLCTRHFNGYFQ